MLTIRPTKILAKRLGIDLPKEPPAVSNRVADWCAHEFQLGRYRHLIFCNTASIFPVVTHARGVTDDRSLIKSLHAALKTNLEGTELDAHYQRWIVPELSAVQWAPIPGKSVLGSINEMVFASKVGLEDQGFSSIELSRWLAQTPLSTLGMNRPDRVFQKLGGAILES